MSMLMKRLFARLMDEANAGEGGGTGGGDPEAGSSGDPSAPGAGGPPAGDEGDKGGEPAAPKDGQSGEKDAAPVAPEKYDLTMPDGFVADPELMGEFETLAKEAKLPNEVAQKFVSLAPKMAERIQQQQAEQWAEQVSQWAKDCEADKEFGGDKFKESVGHAQKALGEFGTPELRAALDQTGYGNHPELLRMLAKIGRAMSDDGMVRGGQGGGKRAAADIMFGDSTN